MIPISFSLSRQKWSNNSVTFKFVEFITRGADGGDVVVGNHHGAEKRKGVKSCVIVPIAPNKVAWIVDIVFHAQTITFYAIFVDLYDGGVSCANSTDS